MLKEKINRKKYTIKFDFLNSVCIFVIGFAAFDDWETHQLYSKTETSFILNGGPRLRVALSASGLQRGETLKSYILGVLSFYRRSKPSHTKSHT